MRKLLTLTAIAATLFFKGKLMTFMALTIIVVFGLTLGATRSAQAVELSADNTFVLDFIANGDGAAGPSNFPVAVYWKWDGANTLGIRMETPNTSVGHGAL